MNNKIAKSPEMLRKEAEVKDLQAQLKKRQSSLKSLKTRLKNTQQEIEEISRKIHVQLFHKIELVDALRKEIAELAQRMKKIKGLSRMDKEQLKMMADEISSDDLFGPGYKEYKGYRAERESGNFNFDEFERAKMNNMFQQFQVKPDEKEQKDIRKVFLKLSQKFHPDLAKGEKETEDFHSLMQQINEAYQHNDIQTLLEFESMYLHQELDFSTKAITVDALQQEIARLKRDLHFIEQQIERTSHEIKNLRQSEIGMMLSSYNKADKSGMGFNQADAHFDTILQMFTKLRDGLKDSIEKGRMSPILMDLMMEDDDEFDGFDQYDAPLEGNDPIDLLIRMAKGDEEALNMFSDFFEDDVKVVENPRFPIGSSVRVKKDAPSPFSRKVNMKGWVARVNNAYYDEKNRVMYDVAFDSVTIKQMPVTIITSALENDNDFQDMEIREDFLEACMPRDTEDESIATYRTKYHQYAWLHLEDPAQARRLQDILLRLPLESDEDNWDLYFNEKKMFPLDVVESHFPLNAKAPVLHAMGIEQYDDDEGHIVQIRLPGQGKKRNKKLIPLSNLRAADRLSPAAQILDDYATWADYTLFS